jgi:hypothetical protein
LKKFNCLEIKNTELKKIKKKNPEIDLKGTTEDVRDSRGKTCKEDSPVSYLHKNFCSPK